jgi:hypothetical protein
MNVEIGAEAAQFPEKEYVSGIAVAMRLIYWACPLGTSLRPPWMQPMSPKARGVAQHGGPPTCREESDPAGVILYMMDRPYLLPFPYHSGSPDRSCPAVSWWNFNLLLYSKCTLTSIMSYVTQGRHDLSHAHAFSLDTTLKLGGKFIQLLPAACTVQYMYFDIRNVLSDCM